MMMFVLLPFWTSLLVRIAAWMAMLQDQGVLNSMLVSSAFGLATLVVAILLGWYLGPLYGAVGAGFPPIGIAFVPSDEAIGEQISAALFVVLLLCGAAWLTGRVRERYGHPPWGRSEGRSE